MFQNSSTRNFWTTPSDRPPGPPVSASAFTLIELLVVVGVIATLSAVLLPALATAMDVGRRVQCLNNQKEMILAWAMYPLDNREKLVLNGGASGAVKPTLWVYGGNHGTPDSLTNTQYLVHSDYALFAPYLRPVQIYKCPGDRSLWPVRGLGNVFELRSYAMNVYLGTPTANVIAPLTLNSSYKTYLKTSELTSTLSANRFVFSDVNPASICTPAFGVDMVSDVFVHYPSSFHRGQGVVAFADGHVESHKWRDPRTKRGLPGSALYIPHNDPSPNNQV